MKKADEYSEEMSRLFPAQGSLDTLRAICIREADIGLPKHGRFLCPSKLPHGEAIDGFRAITDRWLGTARGKMYISVLEDFREVGLELLGLHDAATLDPASLNREGATGWGVRFYVPLREGGYLEPWFRMTGRTGVSGNVTYEYLLGHGHDGYDLEERPVAVAKAFIQAVLDRRP